MCVRLQQRAASVLVLVGETGDLLEKVKQKAKALVPGTEAVSVCVSHSWTRGSKIRGTKSVQRLGLVFRLGSY